MPRPKLNLNQFLANWQLRFPNCEPVPHFLRQEFGERWVRFHSFPESRTDPKSTDEFLAALDRHNRILGELVDTERTVVLLTTEYSETSRPVRTNADLLKLDPDARFWRTVLVDDDPDDPIYWHVFASVWEWRPGRFNPIVQLIIADILANVMIVDPACRWLLHPYYAGMDIIAESETSRDLLKANFSQWLSSHPEGL